MSVTKELVVPAAHEGLHCRVAVRLVAELERFDAVVSFSCGAQVADGRSIVDLLALGCGPGCRLVVRAEGPEAAMAVAAVEQVLTDDGDG